MDMTHPFHRPDRLAPAARILIGELYKYAHHYSTLGEAGSKQRIRVDPQHTPNGEGFTLHQQPSGLGYLPPTVLHALEFLHVTRPEPGPSLTFAAYTGTDEATVYSLDQVDVAGVLVRSESWTEDGDLEKMKDIVEEAVFNWILNVSAKTPRIPHSEHAP